VEALELFRCQLVEPGAGLFGVALGGQRLGDGGLAGQFGVRADQGQLVGGRVDASSTAIIAIDA
jgi:hypothetical protein